MVAGGEESEQALDAAPVVTQADGTEAFDTVADGHEYPLDPKSVVAAQLTAAVWVASIGGILLIAAFVIALGTSLDVPLKLTILAGWTFLAGLAATLAYRWPHIRYQHIRYRVDGNGFTVRRGVLWRSITSVPKARVQHTDVSQGPLQRNYGLASLVIHTAGTQDSSVTVRGLPHATATRIRDYLIEGGDRIGV